MNCYLNVQYNLAISNSLISKFCLYRSSICSPAGHNVNTKDDRLYRNLDISKYSSGSPELRYNRIILYPQLMKSQTWTNCRPHAFGLQPVCVWIDDPSWGTGGSFLHLIQAFKAWVALNWISSVDFPLVDSKLCSKLYHVYKKRFCTKFEGITSYRSASITFNSATMALHHSPQSAISGFISTVHVQLICQTSFYQLRSVRRSLSVNACTALVHAFVTSRLDYCNSLLTGNGDGLIDQLQTVLRVAARLVLRKRKFNLGWNSWPSDSIGFPSVQESTSSWVSSFTSVSMAPLLHTSRRCLCRNQLFQPSPVFAPVFHPDGLGGGGIFPPKNFKFPQNSADNNVVFRCKWRSAPPKFEIPPKSRGLDETLLRSTARGDLLVPRTKTKTIGPRNIHHFWARPLEQSTWRFEDPSISLTVFKQRLKSYLFKQCWCAIQPKLTFAATFQLMHLYSSVRSYASKEVTLHYITSHHIPLHPSSQDINIFWSNSTS